MSFCRINDNNFRCEVYCYVDASGYVIQTARMRYVSDEPVPELPEAWWDVPVNELTAALEAQRAWQSRADLVAIELPNAGRMFCEATAAEAVERLEALRAEGFLVPDSVFLELRSIARSSAEADADAAVWADTPDGTGAA